MRNFYTKIVKYTKLILSIFGVLFFICLFCRQFIQVNYDMNDYLPEDSPSTVALDIMNEEFDGDIPNARVMIYNVTIPQALDYKEQLSSIDGVTSVTWLDDTETLTTPIETLDSTVVENYYKDNTALYSVTIAEDKRDKAVTAIRNLIGNDNAMSGSAVATAIATATTVTEVGKIAAFAVAFVIFILLLTTTSWAEPFIVLCGLGVAIIINAGSNLIFGEISFVTNAAGNILQLAVSLDYSVFLIHRFNESRLEFTNLKEAMVDALCKSTISISSSGLTTVTGFLALCLMRFRIGPDLGLTLAKGVAISLITVFVFSPSLILITYKLIDKTRHRSFMPSFNTFGKVVQKLMIPLTVIFAVLIVPSYLASTSNSYYYGSSHLFNETTQLGKDTASIEDTFGKSDTYVLLVPRDNPATEKELCDNLLDLAEVTDIISYVNNAGAEIPTEYVDADTLSKLISPNYSRIVLSVDADYEGAETETLIEKIRDIANIYYPDTYYLAGEGISTYDLMDTITQDMVKVNLIAIGAVFLVLLITMKSILLPIILVLSIETAIWINLSVPYFTNQIIFYIAYLIISSIQLGATVDYAILLTDRYKELRQTLDKREAIPKTIATVIVSILTSGTVLTITGFLLGAISTHGLLSQLGYFLGKGTICSLVIVIFVLPGLLYTFDKFVIRQNVNPKIHHFKAKKEVS